MAETFDETTRGNIESPCDYRLLTAEPVLTSLESEP